MSYVNISRQKWHIITFFRKNGIVRALESSSGAQISCSGACSSSSRACISSSGQRLQSFEAPEALFFYRGLAFSPSSATTLPHINYAWLTSPREKSLDREFLKKYLCRNMATKCTDIKSCLLSWDCFDVLQYKICAIFLQIFWIRRKICAWILEFLSIIWAGISKKKCEKKWKYMQNVYPTR